jgi:hypothetical protein
VIALWPNYNEIIYSLVYMYAFWHLFRILGLPEENEGFIMINTLYIINVKYICTYNMYSIYMLSTDLSHIHNWSQNWNIRFNPNKTESVLFTRRKTGKRPTLTLGEPQHQFPPTQMRIHLRPLFVSYHLNNLYPN